jgi:hypothetical protein
MAPAAKKRAAIVQSNYIPWKGYFDLVNRVDEFVLYDDVQYTRRDWRNRNLIKTPAGTQWLTIPVEVKDKYHQLIRETRIADPRWGKRHWATLSHNYAKARYFAQYREMLEPLFLGSNESLLSHSNRVFIDAICRILGIRTRITWSWDYWLPQGRNERLIALCKAVGAQVYLSGPAAKQYIDESLFLAEGIEVEWMDYTGYAPYRQLYGPFEHGVSVLDLVFNEGADAPGFMKTFAPRAGDSAGLARSSS